MVRRRSSAARALAAVAVLAACSVAGPSGPSTMPPTATQSATPALTKTPTGSSPSPEALPLPSIPPLVEAPLAEDVANDLQAALERRIDERADEPSVSAAVIVPGVGTWMGSAGSANTDDGTPATPETVYAVGSVTKTYVAALTLMFALDDVLGLDDPAADWLDSDAEDKANGATIRQLLAHRSGIASYTANDDILAEGRTWTPGELLELVGEPHFRAGERFEYSNTNYVLLGLILERAGGAPLEQLLRSRILEPHGLSRTFLAGREQVEPPLAHGYGRLTQLQGDLYDGSGFLPNESLATGAWAAGGMAATPSNVALWLYLLRSGEVLGEDLTATMFGEGLGIEKAGFPIDEPSLGHVGAIAGYVTLAFYLVESGNIVVVSTNTDVEDLFVVFVELADIASRA